MTLVYENTDEYERHIEIEAEKMYYSRYLTDYHQVGDLMKNINDIIRYLDDEEDVEVRERIKADRNLDVMIDNIDDDFAKRLVKNFRKTTWMIRQSDNNLIDRDTRSDVFQIFLHFLIKIVDRCRQDEEHLMYADEEHAEEPIDIPVPETNTSDLTQHDTDNNISNEDNILCVSQYQNECLKIVMKVLNEKCDHDEYTKEMENGKEITISRGQIFTTSTELYAYIEEKKYDEDGYYIQNNSKVGWALSKLENLKLIKRKKMQGSGKLITILNYEK